MNCHVSILLMTFVAAIPATASDAVFENARFRAVLGENAAWRSLVDKPSGKDYCPVAAAVRFADAVVGGRTCSADRAELAGDVLTIGLAGCDTRLTYQVIVTDEWIAFRLTGIRGSRPSRATIVRVGITITERVGACLGAGWNDQYAICLRGISLQTSGSASIVAGGPGRERGYAQLTTVGQDEPGPKLEGCGGALVMARTQDLRPILRRLAATYQLPTNAGSDGVPSKDLPVARQSYWFLSFAEKDVERVIDYCHRTGIRQVMMSSGSWCESVGHYTFNKQRYPDGIESLRRTVAKLHAAGILVGMHTFTSKVSKTDAYVTPAPREGFWVDLRGELSGDVAATSTEIRTTTDLKQWPGSPVSKQKVWEGHVTKHQEVIIDNEIIGYDRIGPEGKWDTFLGCRRGALGTRPSTHRAKAECRHFGVDGCINGYILDLDGPLFAETSARLAEIFNVCGFDMIYFDGSEDVDRRRYGYYSSKAHADVMSKITRRPLIHMGGGFTNELWHSYTRDATVDQYPGTYLAYLHAGGTLARFPTCKEHIDRSVRGVQFCQDNMIPGELGWFGINPKRGEYDGLQFDEVEYLMAKSLAYDAPISLQTGFAQLEQHPLTPDILEIIRAYEEFRLAGQVPATVQDQLRETGRDFVMLRGRLLGNGASPQCVRVEGLPKVAGTHDVRAFVGSSEGDAIATVWHYLGKEGVLRLDTPDALAYDVKGEPVKTEVLDGRTVIPLDHRRITLRFPGRTAEQARAMLAAATLELRQPAVLWIRAQDYVKCIGNMTLASKVSIQDSESLSEPVLCSGKIDGSGKTPAHCEYRAMIPRQGRWTLWARVRYPRGGDQSFGIVRPGELVTLTAEQVLGNCGLNEGRWHWTGRGGGSKSLPPGSPIVLSLPAGPFVFQIWPREGSGAAATNPRLDCLCLAEDPDYVPTDSDARKAIEGSRPRSGDGR